MSADAVVELDLHDGDHACILFTDDEEHRLVVGQFLAEGLRKNQRVLNVAHAHSPDTMRDILRRAGADPSACEATGQLTITGAAGAYTPQGMFDPEAMVALLTGHLEQALADGWDGMRGSGDMGWALDGAPGSDRIMEYEARLNEIMPGSRFRALCQYDMRKFPPETLLQVLAVHPVAFIGTQRLENFYFTPAEEILSSPQPAAQLQRWIRNLKERQTNEVRRREQIRQEERLRRLQEELESKDRFLNAAAHELGTPLTPLALQIQYLRASSPDSRLRDHARNIEILERGFERLNDIVEQLLDAVRTERATFQLNIAPVDLCQLARQSAESFEAPARAAGIALHVECPGQAIAQADASRMAQVLDNLLSNATKFTPSGGAVTLSVRKSGQGWEVVVADTGIGLDPEQLPRLFQQFSQVHDPMEVVRGGTGLGLFISRNIVEKHGGRIWAASGGAGQGSQVGFWIPASIRNAATPEPSGVPA